MKKIIIAPFVALVILYLSCIKSLPEPLIIDYTNDIVHIPSSDQTFSLTFCRDTIGHFSLYALLAFALFIDLKRFTSLHPKRIAAISLLSGVAYGLAMELIQENFFPPRAFEWNDVAANAFGCAVGCFAAVIFIRRRGKTESAKP